VLVAAQTTKPLDGLPSSRRNMDQEILKVSLFLWRSGGVEAITGSSQVIQFLITMGVPACKEEDREATQQPLKMGAIYSSETSVVFHQTTQLYIRADKILHSHRCENLKCSMFSNGLNVNKLCGCILLSGKLSSLLRWFEV
jgi:hypothetical protein